MKFIKYTAYVLGSIIIFILGYMVIAQKNVSEVGLDIFTSIKHISGNKVDLENINNKQSIKLGHKEWTALLKKHVSPNGIVNYKTFLKDTILLNEYLKTLSNNPPSDDQSAHEQLAYWINAYNAFTVKLILNNYPLKSIKDISDGLPMINSPWDIKFFKIGDIAFDLNTIEHEILRKKYNEPRIHFAINCASVSCPKLRNEAYAAEYLEEQLQSQAIDFIYDKHKNNITESAIEVSSIFNWFHGDFTKNGTLHDYLRQFHPEIKKEHTIRYLAYDWGLNE